MPTIKEIVRGHVFTYQELHDNLPIKESRKMRMEMNSLINKYKKIFKNIDKLPTRTQLRRGL